MSVVELINFTLLLIISCLVICCKSANEILYENEAEGIKPKGPFLIDAFEVPVNESRYVERLPLAANWHILRQTYNWADAYAACEKNGMHLVVLPTKQDAHDLTEAIFEKSVGAEEVEATEPLRIELGISRRYWIGLTNLGSENGTSWVWAGLRTKLDYDDFWFPGQPSQQQDLKQNNTLTERCVSLWNPVYWLQGMDRHSFNDVPCSEKYYPICDDTEDYLWSPGDVKPTVDSNDKQSTANPDEN